VIIEATFVTSAADASGFPRDGLPELALVGRSNVGKSSLINALARQAIARTSSTPGKTRLANVYRFERGGAEPFYLIDLPGYGYARGGSAGFDDLATGVLERTPAVLLLIDARHPAIASDLAAWRWLNDAGLTAEVVATKTDKLSRAERHRALTANDAAYEHPVLPISAATGEGLDQLWILINRILSNRSSPPPLPLPRNSPPRPRPPRRKS
jgi:GTP-binding protein